MKEDVPTNHPRGAIPILDTEMWLQNDNIQHSHYSKSMLIMGVFIHRSAMTMASKNNILI